MVSDTAVQRRLGDHVCSEPLCSRCGHISGIPDYNHCRSGPERWNHVVARNQMILVRRVATLLSLGFYSQPDTCIFTKGHSSSQLADYSHTFVLYVSGTRSRLRPDIPGIGFSGPGAWGASIAKGGLRGSSSSEG
jgi:hypothetical protein